MKTPTKLAIALIGVATVYTAASWYTGTRIEAVLNAGYTKAEEMSKGKFKIEDIKFERGIFSSTSTATWSTTDPSTLIMLNALTNTEDTEKSEKSGKSDDDKKLTITMRTQYQHGPFAGGTFALAALSSSDVEVIREKSSGNVGKLLDRFNQIFAGKQPFEMRGVYYFDGSSRSSLKGTAFNLELPAGETDKEASHISWDDFEIEATGTLDLSKLAYEGKIPKLTITYGTQKIEIIGLALEGNQERLFENVYVGPAKFSMKGLDISLKNGNEPIDIHLKQLASDWNTSAKDDFIDIAIRTGTESLKVANEPDFGPAHYDYSIKHLHGATLSKFLLDWQNYSNTLFSTAIIGTKYEAADTEEAKKAEKVKEAEEAKETIIASATELLIHAPVVSIDRFSFTTPEGEPRLSVQTTLKDAKPEDIENPVSMLSKIEANGELSVPIALVEKYAKAEGMQLVAPFVKSGFITQENGVLKTTAAFRAMQLTFNGKAFNYTNPEETLHEVLSASSEEKEEGGGK
ncbi:MAG: YdgA family protein [Azoarcus sp.]|jgi:uncharacterized protein YdgA (DUF945 family)|nr:YdgA family protein [Azoarcus sp.]